MAPSFVVLMSVTTDQRQSKRHRERAATGELTSWEPVRITSDRYHARRYTYSLSIVPTVDLLVLDDPEPIKDAADECKHGRLPGDKSEPCGCFQEEAPPVGSERAKGEKARLQLTSANPQRNLPGTTHHPVASLRSGDRAGVGGTLDTAA